MRVAISKERERGSDGGIWVVERSCTPCVLAVISGA